MMLLFGMSVLMGLIALKTAYNYKTKLEDSVARVARLESDIVTLRSRINTLNYAMKHDDREMRYTLAYGHGYDVVRKLSE